MKRITVREDEKFGTKDVVAQIAKFPGQSGIAPEQMRRRIRILDAVDKANGVLELEDADYEVLKALTQVFPFGVVDTKLLQICDDIDVPQG